MGFAGGFSTHLQIEWLMNTPGSESTDFAGSATNHHRFPADLSLHFMGIRDTHLKTFSSKAPLNSKSE